MCSSISLTLSPHFIPGWVAAVAGTKKDAIDQQISGCMIMTLSITVTLGKIRYMTCGLKSSRLRVSIISGVLINVSCDLLESVFLLYTSRL